MKTKDLENYFRKTERISPIFQVMEPRLRGYTPDGLVLFTLNEYSYSLLYDFKPTITPRNLGTILSRHHKYNLGLVIAEYITPRAKKILEENNMAYLDREGNFFLNDGRSFILIEKQIDNSKTKEKRPIAFSKKGLYLIYRILLDLELLNIPYTQVKQRTNVSINTIGRVLNSLNNMGYLISVNNNKELVASKKDDLLENWIKHFDNYYSNGPGVKDDIKLYEELKIAREIIINNKNI